MSTRIASLYAEIGAKTDGFEKGAARVKGGLGSLANDIGRIVPASVLKFATLSGAILAVGDAFMTTLNAAADAEAVNVRLEASLTATGRASEISAEQIDATATSLEHISAFDDESIKSAYTALMQFSNVPTDKMEDIAKAAMNVTAAMGGDLASNAENIGRILETGLIPRSFGFSAALKTQIKAEIDAGNSGKALTLVLDELNKRFGGQAAAQLTTYSGKVEKLKNDWGDLLEAVGKAPLGTGKDVLGTLDQIVLKYQLWVQAGNQVQAQGMTIWDKVPIVGYFTELAKIIPVYNDLKDGTFNAAQTTDDYADAADRAASRTAALNAKLKDNADTVAGIATDWGSLLSSMQNMQEELDNWKKAQEDKTLADQDADKELRAGKITLDEYNTRIAENAKSLDASREAHDKWAKQVIYDFALARASAGGITDKEGEVMIALGEHLGMWGPDVSAALTNVNQTFSTVDTEDAMREIDAVDLALAQLTGRSYVVHITADASGAMGVIGSLGSTGISPTGSISYGVRNQPNAMGGSWVIPSNYGNEGYRMPGGHTASGGETVTVTPAGQQNGKTVYINVTGVVDRAMVQYLAQEVGREMTG
jgi:hypothetical protein